MRAAPSTPGAARSATASRLAESAGGWWSRATRGSVRAGEDAGERECRGLRVLEAHAGAPGAADGLHDPPRVSPRADLPGPAGLGADTLAGAPDHRGPQGEGPRARTVEPVPAGERARGRADESRVRAALRGHGTLADRTRGVQLLGARHREHGGPGPLRQRRAEARVAGSPPRRDDPLGLRDDRAQGRVVGRDQHRGEHRPRRRRLRDQRPQVVDVGHRRPALQADHLHGQERSGESRPLQAAVDDPGAAGRARRPRRPDAHRLRLRRRAPRARRGRLRERAGAGREHAPRRGTRASRSPRGGSARAGSITACGRSASPSGRSS